MARWLESRGVSVLSVDTFKSPGRPTPDAIVKVDDLPPAEFKIMQPKSGSFAQPAVRRERRTDRPQMSARHR